MLIQRLRENKVSVAQVMSVWTLKEPDRKHEDTEKSFESGRECAGLSAMCVEAMERIAELGAAGMKCCDFGA